MDAKMNSKGQITLFIIIGVVLVAMAAIFVFLFRANFEILVGNEFDPESYIQRCLRESFEDKIEVIAKQGGFYDPTDFIVYDEKKATYLCKNINYYQPCINQHPLLITEVQNELEEQIMSDTQSCFDSLENELETRNFVFDGETPEVNITLKPGIVDVNIHRRTTYSQGENELNVDNFNFGISYPLFELAKLAMDIVRQESEFCDFYNDGYALLYPAFVITKKVNSDHTEIYNILHTRSTKEMNIAIRGCVIPQGF